MELQRGHRFIYFINKMNIKYRKVIRIVIFLLITGIYLFTDSFYDVDSIYIVIGVIYALQIRKK